MGRTASLLLAVIATACAPTSPPTWEHNARPLIERSCVGCHDGANDLPPLVTSAQVAERADVALTLMEARIMPPFVVDKSGACGDFSGPRSPSDADIALFAEWVHAGAPLGPGPVATVKHRLSGVDVSLPAFTPTGSELLPRDDHRCFAIDSPGRYLTSIGASGSPALHHVLLFSISSPAPGLVPGSTWECPGSVGIPGAQLVGVWAPGAPSSKFPEGSGAKLNSILVAQLHTAVAADSVEATLTFGVADSVERELQFIPAATTSFVLAPQDSVQHSAIIAPLAARSEVLAVFPHMHVAGRSLTLARASGECLVSAPAWRYSAQEVAIYETPVVIEAREELRLTCEWNTLGRDGVTRFGEGTDDEMCTVFLLH